MYIVHYFVHSIFYLFLTLSQLFFQKVKASKFFVVVKNNNPSDADIFRTLQYIGPLNHELLQGKKYFLFIFLPSWPVT